MYCNVNEIVSMEIKDMTRIYKGILEAINMDDKVIAERKVLIGQESKDSLYKSDSSKGVVYFNHVICKGKQHSYKLGGDDNGEVIRIKQRKFNDELCRRLKKNLKLLGKIDGRFLPYDSASIDEKLSEVYRDQTGLVNKAPGVVDTKEWDRINTKNDYKLPDKCNVAPDGLDTSSKSEIIVYGILKG